MMNRRDFIKTASTAVALSVLPSSDAVAVTDNTVVRYDYSTAVIEPADYVFYEGEWCEYSKESWKRVDLETLRGKSVWQHTLHFRYRDKDKGWGELNYIAEFPEIPFKTRRM